MGRRRTRRSATHPGWVERGSRDALVVEKDLAGGLEVEDGRVVRQAVEVGEGEELDGATAEEGHGDEAGGRRWVCAGNARGE